MGPIINKSTLIPITLILLGCGLWPEMELLVPSLPSMKKVFGIGDGEIQQLLTANFFGFLLGVLVAGPLCDSLGRKAVLKYGAIGYLISSALCIFSGNFYVLMAARFLQGIAMTGPVIAGSVIMMEMTSGPKQVFWMSLANSMVTFCMAAAPIIGAWINDAAGYKGNLWSILILGIVGITPSLVLAPETLVPMKRTRFKPTHLFKGYLALLKDWRFMIFATPICSLAAAYWVYVGVSALYMVDHLGIQPSLFGRYQGPIVGCFAVFSLGSSRLLTKFGLENCLRTGIICMFSGAIPLFIMSALSQDSAIWTTLFMMLFVGGMAPLCSLLFPYCLKHLPDELQGSAQAMIQAIRLALASLGTFILGFIYSGPLLPVATILLAMLCLSTLLLWLGRNLLTEDSGDDKDKVTWASH